MTSKTLSQRAIPQIRGGLAPPKAMSARSFQRHLLSWYDQRKRDLPWREDRDPYRVWISEIMLQQTRVAAVIAHYRRFLALFPSVEALAAAKSDHVLAAWSGLGYYRRARALHAAALQIVAQHAGHLPRSVPELRALPGVGAYTAAAIASIAFEVPTPAVDGNVERVLARLSGNTVNSGDAWRSAAHLLNKSRPGDFNQAMMELGATVCTPAKPACATCPVFRFCRTRGPGRRQKSPARRRRRLHFRLARSGGCVFLVQRSKDESLMADMWELPSIGVTRRRSPDSDPVFTLRHSITDTDYLVTVTCGIVPKNMSGDWVPISQLSTLALTGLARKILQRSNLI